ncbi:hypothetical protein K488DRAFT_85364 [Vararia minispora EC-137]|uniref:Uncharacterized protein n=1 Tax=Vararia minispora EC-137 TaxID=1314806 RepID=A0ACB8QME4_9AGAM|nr:hypothetical protein K488DRAFT_85364 [Vararia minispora EC-137]
MHRLHSPVDSLDPPPDDDFADGLTLDLPQAYPATSDTRAGEEMIDVGPRRLFQCAPPVPASSVSPAPSGVGSYRVGPVAAREDGAAMGSSYGAAMGSSYGVGGMCTPGSSAPHAAAAAGAVAGSVGHTSALGVGFARCVFFRSHTNFDRDDASFLCHSITFLRFRHHHADTIRVPPARPHNTNSLTFYAISKLRAQAQRARATYRRRDRRQRGAVYKLLNQCTHEPLNKRTHEPINQRMHIHHRLQLWLKHISARRVGRSSDYASDAG